MKTISIVLRGEECDIEVDIAPAEPEVGIMSRYVAEVKVVEHPDWELTDEEFQAVNEAVEDL